MVPIPAVIQGVITGIKIYRAVKPILGGQRKRSAPRHSSMVLSPDGRPMYQHTFNVGGRKVETMEVRNKIVR